MKKAPSKYRQLLQQRAALDKQIEAAREHEKKFAIEQIEDLIAEFGIAPEELGMVAIKKFASKKVPASAKTFKPKEPPKPLPPKYRNPETGQTWSGRGHTPGWMVGDKDEYLIDPDKKTPQPKRITQNNKEAA